MDKKYILLILFPIVVLGLSLMLYKSQDLKRVYKAEVLEGVNRDNVSEIPILSENDIKHLPTPVQKYLTYVGVMGKQKVRNFKISFDGQMKMDQNKDWINVKTEQHNFIANPTRMFYIEGSMLGIPMLGLDSYKNGKGNMLIKLGGLFTVANALGSEMDSGAAVTLFNDMCLMAPSTLIDPRIQWESVDALTAKASFNDNGCIVSAVLYFNTLGELTNFSTDDRYMTVGKTYQKVRWSTPVRDYKDYNGLKLPSYGEGVWHLPEGDFCYAQFKVKEIEYNCKGL